MAAETPKGDLSVTALYTSHVWTWGKLPCAELLATPDAKIAFSLTNGALGVARFFVPGGTSLPHSLLHRHTMIDHLLRTAEPAQVLELAAGLSRRGAAFTADPGLSYTELDLPHVIQRKRELFERTQEGKAVLARPNFHLFAGDATDADLTQLVAPGKSLFVIAEGLFMYLGAEAQRQLWEKVRGLFDRVPSATFVFDLVPSSEQPKAGAAGQALESLMKKATKGQGFTKDLRTRDDIRNELEVVGFPRIELLEPRDVAAEWGLPFAEVPTQQLLFVCRSR